jgi:flavorubredoxin
VEAGIQDRRGASRESPMNPTHQSTCSGSLPRELAPGLFWLGQCNELELTDRFLHSYNSVYLVTGSEASLLVDCIAPADYEAVETQLDSLLDTGLAPLRYAMPTHPETNHSSGLGRLMERFPDAQLVGDPTDLHLNFPEYVDRLRDPGPREALDLGGRSVMWVPAIFRDLPSTRWFFDSTSRTLFAGDGLSFTHYHEAGQCGSTAEESVAGYGSLDVLAMMQLFSEAAFKWLSYVDVESLIGELEALITDLDVQMIAPAHGLPVTDVPVTMPFIYDGLRGANRS